jgi:hypothetical protein
MEVISPSKLQTHLSVLSVITKCIYIPTMALINYVIKINAGHGSREV